MELKVLVHDELTIEGTAEEIEQMAEVFAAAIIKHFRNTWWPLGTTVSLHFKFPPFPGAEPNR